MPPNGWLIVDKPEGLTSAQVVARVKRLFGAKKVGHGGTLDPLATGVLPIALGEATKALPFILDGTKAYRFEVQWGEARRTDDREGAVTVTSSHRPSPQDIAAALPAFTGVIEQIPPIYSALKVDGKRAYALARAGVDVILAPRRVEIFSLTLLDTSPAPLVDDSAGVIKKGEVTKKTKKNHLTVSKFCDIQENIKSQKCDQTSDNPRDPSRQPQDITSQPSNSLNSATLLHCNTGDTPHPPLRGDLSHKGRGKGALISFTSPLVGEVAAQRRVRGYSAQQKVRTHNGAVPSEHWELNTEHCYADTATFEVVCSKGTYVRSLARDLAVALGTYGHVKTLRRTRAGPFCEKDAILLDSLLKVGHNSELEKYILPLQAALVDILALEVDGDGAAKIHRGQSIPSSSTTEAEVVLIMCEGVPQALAKHAGGRIIPFRVFNMT